MKRKDLKIRIIDEGQQRKLSPKNPMEFAEIEVKDFIAKLELGPNQFCFVLTSDHQIEHHRNVQSVLGFKNKDLTYKKVLKGDIILENEKVELFKKIGMALVCEIKITNAVLLFEYAVGTKVMDELGTMKNLRIKMTTLQRNFLKRPTSILFICSDLGEQKLNLRSSLSITEREPYYLEPDYGNIRRKDEVFSRREKDVLSLLAQGMSSKMIGDELGITKNTVDVHRRNILQKTACGNTAEMISKAVLYAWV